MDRHLDDWLDLVAEKDEVAFDHIYSETNHGVYAVIASLIRDRGVVEDLMQDTYMKMLQRLHTYQKGRNFAAWLMQIAKNLAYDYLRKESTTSVLDPQEDTRVFDLQANAEVDDQPTLDMEKLLAGLDDLERQIVMMRIVSDTKFKTIAELTQKPLGTVLWIYQKAVKKMQITAGKEDSQ